MSRTVRYRLRGVTFEWDTAKASSNLLRHGVPFELACEVFFDPFIRVTDAEEQIIRIISARLATPQERRSYEEL